MSSMSRSEQQNLSFERGRRQGIAAFQRARRQAFLSEVYMHLRGKPAELLSYEDIRARLRLREESYRGVQNVPLDQIVGSVGRYHEFTRTFLPRRTIVSDRWARVYAVATVNGLPPIEVYQVGCVYFVRDGNHRVSVARLIGFPTIEAHVTEVTSPVCLTPDVSPQALDAATCYAAFLEESRLRYLHLDYLPFELSEPSRYEDLLGHIQLHRSVYQETTGCSMDMADAAADWWEHVFYPLMAPIHNYGVLERFPGRTKADLFLWASDHLGEIGQACKVSSTAGLQNSLTDFLAARNIVLPDSIWSGTLDQE